MEDDLGVTGGGEDRAAVFERPTKHVGIDQVAIVADRDRAVARSDANRLRIPQLARA